MSLQDFLPQVIYLKPAELVVAEQSALVMTVLGSCVAVTFFSPRLRVGGICHAMLPSGKDQNAGKYVDQSVHYMLDCFRTLNVEPGELVAKLFGGAEMFHSVDSRSEERTVGAQNIRMALDSMLFVGLEPVVSDVGGQQGRKLIFHSGTGAVKLRRLPARDRELLH